MKGLMADYSFSDILNGHRGVSRTLLSSPPRDLPQRLADLQESLVRFYSELPPALVWSANTFKDQVSRGQGGVFLTLHCMANAFLALVHHPSILFSPNGADTPMTTGVHRSLRLSLASSRVIAECMVYADLASPISFYASPHLTQALYIAGVAFGYEAKQKAAGMPRLERDAAGESNDGATDAFLHLIAQQNLDTIVGALSRLERYWTGAGLPLNVLKQRLEGLSHASISMDRATKDTPTFVSVRDAGVLRRFTGDLDALADCSPGTQLQAIQATEWIGGTESYSLEQLLARYSVDDFSVQPADVPFDLSMLYR